MVTSDIDGRKWKSGSQHWSSISQKVPSLWHSMWQDAPRQGLIPRMMSTVTAWSFLRLGNGTWFVAIFKNVSLHIHDSLLWITSKHIQAKEYTSLAVVIGGEQSSSTSASINSGAIHLVCVQNTMIRWSVTISRIITIPNQQRMMLQVAWSWKILQWLWLDQNPWSGHYQSHPPKCCTEI